MLLTCVLDGAVMWRHSWSLIFAFLFLKDMKGMGTHGTVFSPASPKAPVKIPRCLLILPLGNQPTTENTLRAVHTYPSWH